MQVEREKEKECYQGKSTRHGSKSQTPEEWEVKSEKQDSIFVVLAPDPI